MISREDCVALCGLTEEEVPVVAEYRHMPEISAVALAEYLVKNPHGLEQISDTIVEDICATRARGSEQHVQTLVHHYFKDHPEARAASKGGALV